MQVNVSFRHMDASPAVQQYATDKLEHVVSKYVQGADIDAQATFSVEKIWHIANFTININGLTVKSTEKREDMYTSIDLALEKVERQVRRYKSKIRNYRPDQRLRSLSVQVLAAPETDETFDSDAHEIVSDDAVAATPAAAPAAPAAPAASPADVLDKEFFTAPFLSTEDAAVQLELSDSHFLVFTNETTERINIVYKREDGRFALIDVEPEQH